VKDDIIKINKGWKWKKTQSKILGWSKRSILKISLTINILNLIFSYFYLKIKIEKVIK